MSPFTRWTDRKQKYVSRRPHEGLHVRGAVHPNLKTTYPLTSLLSRCIETGFDFTYWVQFSLVIFSCFEHRGAEVVSAADKYSVCWSENSSHQDHGAGLVGLRCLLQAQYRTMLVRPACWSEHQVSAVCTVLHSGWAGMFWLQCHEVAFTPSTFLKVQLDSLMTCW